MPTPFSKIPGKYWEQSAKDVAEISGRLKERIHYLIKNDVVHQQAFADFLDGLQKNIHPGIVQKEAIEMLGLHIITKPVFEALFDGYSFVKNNPVSVSMQPMLYLLEDQAFDKDAKTLQKFYESVKMRAGGIDNAEDRQRIIIELYDKFFKTAFPKMVERLGIVHTPLEVVDFIIHSVNDVLKKEFNCGFGDENVQVLDPFTGTGTFIIRLLQSGLINKKDLERKYQHEIHANEIVLLAYYIAAVNIENAYHDAMGKTGYKPFEGICLTDTFQLGEKDDSEKMFVEMFLQNAARVAKQKKAPLKVIIGNPPYSVGQRSANDNAQNQRYPVLDEKIANTYAAASSGGLNKSLYDTYIKAFRWSTDQLDENGGVLCFVSNGGWLDGNSTDGFRKTLEKEFTSIYVINLRGNGRTSGERCRQEGEPLFAAHGGKGGSLTPVTIVMLIKNPERINERCEIFYHDIGMYLKRAEKLSLIREFRSVSNIPWVRIHSNEHGDWLNQRNDVFENFIAIEAEKKFNTETQSFFNTHAIGVSTNRDAWMYNFSKKKLEENMQQMIAFYNEQQKAFVEIKKINSKIEIGNFVDTDPKNISWTRFLRRDASKAVNHHFKQGECRKAGYRPFCKQNLYFDKPFVESPGLSSLFFPNDKIKNLVISVTGAGSVKSFSTLISDSVPNLDCIEKAQCFPLFYYEERQKQSPGLFDAPGNSDYIRRDGISDFIWERAKAMYGKTVSKEDIFYYVYGFLHSPEYREKFANDLKKILPRLPLVENVKDFWSFSKAGRSLADLHINYETVPAFDAVKVTGAETGFYKVEKMRFPKKDQKNTILYNSKITIENIPAKAYDYVVNGKSAIEWIMERYQITTHKESGIINDPNDWAHEVGNPKYILDLLLSIINVSVQTVDVVNSLPKKLFE